MKEFFEDILRHCEVDDGGPLLFVEEVVVGDGQEGHFVDGLEGCQCVEVHAAAHQFLKGFVMGGKGDVCGTDGLGSSHACGGIVVLMIDRHVHVFVSLCHRVEVKICGGLWGLRSMACWVAAVAVCCCWWRVCVNGVVGAVWGHSWIVFGELFWCIGGRHSWIFCVKHGVVKGVHSWIFAGWGMGEGGQGAVVGLVLDVEGSSVASRDLSSSGSSLSTSSLLLLRAVTTPGALRDVVVC